MAVQYAGRNCCRSTNPPGPPVPTVPDWVSMREHVVLPLGHPLGYSFTLGNTPITDSVRIYDNDGALTAGEYDYTVAGNVVTINWSGDPDTGVTPPDKLQVDYMVAQSVLIDHDWVSETIVNNVGSFTSGAIIAVIPHMPRSNQDVRITLSNRRLKEGVDYMIMGGDMVKALFDNTEQMTMCIRSRYNGMPPGHIPTVKIHTVSLGNYSANDQISLPVPARSSDDVEVIMNDAELTPVIDYTVDGANDKITLLFGKEADTNKPDLFQIVIVS